MSEHPFAPEERCRALSVAMTRWKSETGTEGERDFGPKLAATLSEWPYFRAHPENLKLVPSHDGTMNVVALVRGQPGHRRTLAFAGHYDTVPVANYRDLASLATEPDLLLDALLADLGSRPLGPQEEKALADFESGDFIPGRGLLDMKCGLAAGLAVLEHFTARSDLAGNLLFMATPDEERNSRGMRSMRDALPGLAREWDLEIVGGINLDSTSDQGDGAEGRAIYRGTIGKLLPFAYVIGQPSHASYPFEGVSAHLIAAEILRRIEANPALCDTGDGEVSPPPICLEGKDFRGGYDVTTPDAVWLGFNWLFHSWSQDRLLARFNGIVTEAVEWATATLAGHAEAYAALSGTGRAEIEPGFVISFAELKARAFAAGGPAAEERFAARAQEVAALGNPLETSRLLTAHLIAEARLTGPAVVTGIAGLHYPPTRLDSTSPPTAAFEAAIEAARQEMEERHRVGIRYRNIFTGISDMSFFGHRPPEAAIDAVAGNTADPAMVDRPPAEALVFPVVNIGPWGREYHQRLERAHARYAFRDLPIFLQRIVLQLLMAQ